MGGLFLVLTILKRDSEGVDEGLLVGVEFGLESSPALAFEVDVFAL